MKKNYYFTQESLVKIWVKNHFKVEAESEEEALTIARSFTTVDIATSDHSHLVFDTEYLSESYENLSPDENDGKRTVELYDNHGVLIGSNEVAID